MKVAIGFDSLAEICHVRMKQLFFLLLNSLPKALKAAVAQINSILILLQLSNLRHFCGVIYYCHACFTFHLFYALFYFYFLWFSKVMRLSFTKPVKA